jgi:hypothetical protein
MNKRSNEPQQISTEFSENNSTSKRRKMVSKLIIKFNYKKQFFILF